MIDPGLRPKVDFRVYAEQLEAFKNRYGAVRPWHVRADLHMDGSSNKRDKRPFAYAYVVWQDKANDFHMFRERWVKDNTRWFTRVVGLIPRRS
jgi:hypothetical protein